MFYDNNIYDSWGGTTGISPETKYFSTIGEVLETIQENNESPEEKWINCLLIHKFNSRSYAAREDNFPFYIKRKGQIFEVLFRERNKDLNIELAWIDQVNSSMNGWSYNRWGKSFKYFTPLKYVYVKAGNGYISFDGKSFMDNKGFTKRISIEKSIEILKNNPVHISYDDVIGTNTFELFLKEEKEQMYKFKKRED